MTACTPLVEDLALAAIGVYVLLLLVLAGLVALDRFDQWRAKR
jgi:hypothetical protein